MEKKKWGKPATIVEGVGNEGKELSKKLKSKLACGGTFKNDRIELRGDHRSKIKDVLIKLGYDENQIEVI